MKPSFNSHQLLGETPGWYQPRLLAGYNSFANWFIENKIEETSINRKGRFHSAELSDFVDDGIFCDEDENIT